MLGDSELEAALNKIRQLSISDATDETGTTSNTDFQSTISQVLKDLTANSENLKVFQYNPTIIIILVNIILRDNNSLICKILFNFGAIKSN